MERKISLIQQLLLEGLFFKVSFCHKGSSQISLCHGSHQRGRSSDNLWNKYNHVYVIGEVLYSCGNPVRSDPYPRCYFSILQSHSPRVNQCNIFIFRYSNKSQPVLYIADYPATLALLHVSIKRVDSWLLIWEAGSLQRATNGLYGKSMWTHLSINGTLSYLLMPSLDRQDGCYWREDKQHVTACRFSLRGYIRQQDYLV